MNNSPISHSYLSQSPILSTGNKPAGIRDTCPTQADSGVLDPKTFDAIEAEQLFDSIDHAVTHIGKSVLYRSLARPGTDADVLRKKQEALRELESNPGLR
ncbi:MAG TPA: DNA mismatch repair protein MutS, partial [Nitrosospira sp.]|nr:DNA mismatch repair protein MutS [Nitrosospira sp.]